MPRVALVTGGSGALGQAIVHRFLHEGDIVCVPWIVEAERARLEGSLEAARRRPAGGFIGYTVAKAGVLALMQALPQEVKAGGVTVHAVAPSTMDTPANRAAMPNVDPKTWVPVTAVADAVAALAAESAGHVTGTLLQI